MPAWQCGALLPLLVLLLCNPTCTGATGLFNITAAWEAAIATGPSAGVSEPEGGYALPASNISLANATIYTIRLPPGHWTLTGNVTVLPGQLLVLQGYGGLLQPQTPGQQAPLSMWIMNGSRDDSGYEPAHITLLPGASAWLRNLTLFGPALGTAQGGLGFVPDLFTLPPNQPWAAAIVFQFVAVLLQDCDQLHATQQRACNMILEDSNTPWPAMEQEPGWLAVVLIQRKAANVTINGCLYVCDWPLPPLMPFESYSLTPSHSPNAPPLLGTALLNNTLVSLTKDGFPLDGSVVGSLAMGNSTQRRMPCAARRVTSPCQLMRAVVELQAMSTQDVVIQLVANLTLQQHALGPAGNDTYVWPQPNTALRVYRNVTILGRQAIAARVTEIDFGLLRNIFWLDNTTTSHLKFQQITMANLPCGPRAWFPVSLNPTYMFPVAWDRLHANHTFVEMKNCTIIQPVDTFTYFAYWTGIRASPIPSVRQLADWLSADDFQGTLVASNDSHTLFLQKRWGQGIQWTNTTFTDLPVVARLQPLSCGIASLVPGAPTYPYAYITPVFDASQLATYLQAPPTPILMLMHNMTVQDVPPIPVHLKSTLTVLGWWQGSTALDLGNEAALMQLQAGTGQQLSLQRLVLTGLGAAGPSQEPQELANFTSMIWALGFPRSVLAVVDLQNVTLVVPPAELEQLRAQALQGQPAALNSGTSSASNTPAPTAGLQNLYSDWHASRVASATNDSLNISQIVWSGIEAKDLLVTSRLPSSLAGLPIVTAAPQGLQLPSQPTQPKPEGGRQLNAWQVPLLVVGCVLLAVLLTAGVVVLWWRRARQQQREQLVVNNAADKKAGIMESANNSQQTHPSRSSVGGEDGEASDPLHTGPCAMEEGHAEDACCTTSGPLSSSRVSGDVLATRVSIRTTTSSRAAAERSQPGQACSKPPSTLGAPSTQHDLITAATLALQNEIRSEIQQHVGAQSLAAAAAAAGDERAPHDLQQQHELNSGQLLVLETVNSSQGHAMCFMQPAGGSSSCALAVASAAATAGGSVPVVPVTGDGAYTGTWALRTRPTAAAAKTMLGVTRGSHDVADLVQRGVIQLGQPGPSIAEVAMMLSQRGSPRPSPADGTLAAGVVAAAAGSSHATQLGGGSPLLHPLLEQGLAAGDIEHEPGRVLQQVIAHRKELQGIDMQQITFEHVLGQGSFGVVYKGKWRSLTVAIKALMFQDAGAAKRVRQRAITEAAINTLLTHDNIVNTFAYDLRPWVGSNMPDEAHATSWKLYIVQEYCNSGSLAQAIDSGLFMDGTTGYNKLELTLQVAQHIAQGMAYIHDNNVIHGDLSSGNVLLHSEASSSPHLTAKVGDFGLSRFLEGPNHSHISNARQGTPFYIAPEVLSQGVISRPADVFSFGVLLWEMFCGIPPWRDPALVSYRRFLNPLYFPYHVPMNCPSEYHALIVACLADNPKARPTFHELQVQLKRLLHTVRDVLGGSTAAPCTEQQQQQQFAPPQQQQQQQVSHMQWRGQAVGGVVGVAAASQATAAGGGLPADVVAKPASRGSAGDEHK